MNYLRTLTLVLIGATAFGCYSGRLGESTGDAAVMTLNQAEQSMVDRWNQTAADNPSSFTAGGWNFNWPTFNQFPHPTFRGGSLEAYQEFARLLLIYTQTGDNFEFLAGYRLFDVELIDSSVAPGAQFGTLRELVTEFTTGIVSTYGFSAEITDGLKQLKAKIDAV